MSRKAVEEESSPKYRNATLTYQTSSPIKPKFRIQNLHSPCNHKSPSSLLMKEKAVIKTCWSVVNVQPFPLDIPMQRTCFEVNNENTATVARRISNSNRIRSIDTDYDNETASVDCTASRNTKYRIQLHYKNESFESPGNSIIIVRMQRKSGCSLIFQEEYRAILQAAKHNVIMVPDEIDSSRVMNLRLPNIPDIPLEDGILEQSLEHAQSNLLSDQHDTRMLGLENLASTTNPHVSSDDIARDASKIIMMDEIYLGIRESITSLMFQNDEEDDDFVEEAKYIRSLVLTILANTMSALSGESILTSFIRDERWCILSFIPLLLEDIKNAAKQQYNASLAARCLLILFKDSEEARSKAGRDVLITLESAKHVGRLSHAQLEMEAQGAMDQMIVGNEKSLKLK